MMTEPGAVVETNVIDTTNMELHSPWKRSIQNCIGNILSVNT